VSAPEPLSEQRRAEIERYRESARGSAAVTGVIYRMHVGGLLAEVDRLRAITERGAATIEAARRLVDVHEQRGGINGVLAARKNLSAALAALADPVRLPEPEPPSREAVALLIAGPRMADNLDLLAADRVIAYFADSRLPEKGEPADG
jgi:hypothetical protein